MEYLPALLFALVGAASALPMGWVLNRMPAKCFCDYGEEPSALHAAPRITPRQTLVCALILALGFALIQRRFGISVQSVSLCLFLLPLVMIAVSDKKYAIIPDELIIAGCVLATVSAIPGIFSGGGVGQCLSPVLGAAIGGGVILAINLMGRLVYKKDALGMGDLKLMVVCGIACGTVGIVVALLVGILAAALFFALRMAAGKTKADEYLPLGPFLVLGTGFTLCCQPLVDRFINWYISLL